MTLSMGWEDPGVEAGQLVGCWTRRAFQPGPRSQRSAGAAAGHGPSGRVSDGLTDWQTPGPSSGCCLGGRAVPAPPQAPPSCAPHPPCQTPWEPRSSSPLARQTSGSGSRVLGRGIAEVACPRAVGEELLASVATDFQRWGVGAILSTHRRPLPPPPCAWPCAAGGGARPAFPTRGLLM